MRARLPLSLFTYLVLLGCGTSSEPSSAQIGTSPADDASVDGTRDDATVDAAREDTSLDGASHETTAADGGDAPGESSPPSEAAVDVSPFDAPSEAAIDAGPISAGCATYANTYCSALAGCSPYHLARLYVDEPGCRAGIGHQCVAWYGSGASSALDACTAAYAAASCDVISTFELPAACVSATAKGTGASCSDPRECKSRYCAHDDKSLCGTCYPEPKTGDFMLDIIPNCGPGFASNGLGKCMPWRHLGEACGTTQGRCLPDLSCKGGVCGKAAELGEACDTVHDTGAPFCNLTHNLYCTIPDGGVCAKITPRLAGESCKEDWSTLCVGSGSCSALKCQVGPSAGESCTSNPWCVAPSFCNKTCMYGSEGLCK